MWRQIGLLLGGYGFIAFSCAWAWWIVCALGRRRFGRGIAWFPKPLLRTALTMMAAWTFLWAALVGLAYFV